MFDSPRGPDQCAPASMTIGRPRKDGRYPVRFNYPSSGRTFRKLLTEEQVRKDLESDYYVIWDYPHIQYPFLDNPPTIA